MDLSETILEQVKKAGGDVSGIMVDEARIREIDEMFSGSLPQDAIVQVLRKHNWSIDESLEELFALNETLSRAKTQQAQKKLLADRISSMREIFAEVDRERITRVVEEHDGDIQLATEALLQLLEDERNASAAKTAEAREAEAQRKRQQLLDQRRALVDLTAPQFPMLSSGEVTTLLGKHNWEIKRAIGALTEASRARKVQNLCAIFKQYTEADVRRALTDNKWNCAQATGLLLRKDERATQLAQEFVVVEPLEHIEAGLLEGERAVDDFMRELVNPVLIDPVASPVVASSGGEDAPQASGEAAKKPDAPVIAEGGAATGNVSVTFDLDADVIPYSGSIGATVNMVGEASAYDYVTLIKVGEPMETNYITWSWFKGAKLTFASPGYGLFELRYLRKNAAGEIVCLSRSPAITVGPKITLSVAGQDSNIDSWVVTADVAEGSEPLTSSAWVGLFQDDTDAYLSFQYLKGAPLTFKKPTINAAYHFRAYASRYNGPNARTDNLAITGDDAVSMRVEGTRLHVTVVAKSANPASDRLWVWVGHINEHRPAHSRRWKYISSPVQTINFKKMIHSGNYEARLYKGADQILVKSDALIIE